MSGTPKHSTMAAVVTPMPDGWIVRRDDELTTSLHSSQAAAIAAARDLLRATGGTLRVHGLDGGIRESLTLGRTSIARINAVEGLFPPDGFAEDLVEFDRLALSSDERRVRVAKAYGGKRR